MPGAVREAGAEAGRRAHRRTTPRSARRPPAASGAGAPRPSVPAAPRQAGRAARAAALVGDTAERDVRVETRDVIAVFTNRGARLKSWRLKHYLDQQRQPLELVASELRDRSRCPFSLRVAGRRDDARR